MRIKITKSGIYGAKGAIAVGTEIDVKEEPKGWAGRYEVILGGSSEGKTPVMNPAQGGSLEARDTGSGWWTVFDADGKQVGKKLREDDAKAFNDLSDEDKVEFVKTEA